MSDLIGPFVPSDFRPQIRRAQSCALENPADVTNVSLADGNTAFFEDFRDQPDNHLLILRFEPAKNVVWTPDPRQFLPMMLQTAEVQGYDLDSEDDAFVLRNIRRIDGHERAHMEAARRFTNPELTTAFLALSFWLTDESEQVQVFPSQPLRGPIKKVHFGMVCSRAD